MKQTKTSLFQIKSTQRSHVLCVLITMVDAAGSLFCWLFCSAAAVAAMAAAVAATTAVAVVDANRTYSA